MKHFFVAAVMLLLLLTAVSGCDSSSVLESGFLVRIENISPIYPDSGVFNTPVGAVDPSPIGPGEMYQFTVTAPEGAMLSFATMMVQSNDLFYAPSGDGIELYPGGTPIDADVTSQLMLWDAGTEVNEEPGVGLNQAPRQSGPDTGTDENGVVQLIGDVGDGYTYPDVDDVIDVTISHIAASLPSQFVVTIENVSTEDTLQTSEGNVAVPLAPGVWVVHTTADPLFTDGEADRGEGLENIAEDGDPTNLDAALGAETGLPVPLAPGVWMVHTGQYEMFQNGVADYGEGLESLAEDGSPADLMAALGAKNSVASVGVFDMPVGTSTPGVAGPGQVYEFTFDAEEGSRLSFATMFVQSNDLFYGTGDIGINLFPNGQALSGTITTYVSLWDAGTEVNEYPGFGPNQPPRQSGPDTGTDESGVVQLVADVGDGFVYPSVSSIIRVTIGPA